ncbi:transcription factor NAI1-like isoform X2 [Ananas comosus]|nr:transcription factor NAI1-like isoform X2 [Ananas comosus]
MYQPHDMGSMDPLSLVDEENSPFPVENYAPDYCFDPSFSGSSSSPTSLRFNPSMNAVKTEGPPTAAASAASASSNILSFGGDDHLLRPILNSDHHSGAATMYSHGVVGKDETIDFQQRERSSKGSSRASYCTAQEHVIAERKRREKLAQQFIALSAMIPDLKKTDKASLLGGAIDHLKQLEEKVKVLEEQATRKTTESTILLKNSHAISNASSADHETLPKVEATLQGKTLLLRIHCEKRKGVLVMILSEIEKMSLTVVNTSVVPFEGSSLHITATAQIEEGFSTTVDDLVKNLSLALSQFK